MNVYINPKWETFLQDNNISTFDALWNRDEEWFEPPNEGRSRNGWSGVCKLNINGQEFFLKKQENFYTYSIKYPFGISVAEREFNNLKMFADLDVPSMNVVYFGVRKEGKNLQAMVMTKNLKRYIPLSEVVEIWKLNKPSLNHRRKVLKNIADLLREAHQKGVMHHSLYPKHIFVSRAFSIKGKEDKPPHSRFIDMEKAVKAPWGSKKQLRDLDTLNRRSHYWSKQDRLYFLLSYMHKEKVDSEVLEIMRKIQSITKD